LVHGGFVDGSGWESVYDILKHDGYQVSIVQNPTSSLAGDVAFTHRVLEKQSGPVVLVGHSYGGAVITEAGNDAKLRALVYVAAFAPDAGESINGLGKGQPPPPWVTKLVVDTAGFASLPTDVVLSDFAQDLKPADAKLVAYKQGPIAARCFDDKIKTAAWQTKPSWFVVPESDHMIDPRAQAFMAKRANSKVTSVKGASHVVMMSRPKDVVAAIVAAASVK
jgi:pimeloyl-ACP methyl ester carboxylesterase